MRSRPPAPHEPLEPRVLSREERQQEHEEHMADLERRKGERAQKIWSRNRIVLASKLRHLFPH